MPAPLADRPTRLDNRLKRFLVWSIVLMTAGYTFLDYWAYSRVEHESPQDWVALASGRGLAPAQYRIGVYFTANFFRQITHLHFHQVFAAFDLLTTSVALACIFFLLVRLESFRRSTLDAQWAQVLLGLLLAQVYLVWTLWFQEPETMPALAILSIGALLCSGHIRVPPAMLAISLLLVALLGATIRADTVTALFGGVFVCFLTTKRPLNDRKWILFASFFAVCGSLLVEFWITHRLFPDQIRSAPAFQLVNNLHALNGAAALACVLGPWVLTAWLGVRQWPTLPAWLQGVLLASIVHFVLFLTFGMSEEVRIFLPFTFTLIPLSATLLFGWARVDSIES